MEVLVPWKVQGKLDLLIFWCLHGGGGQTSQLHKIMQMLSVLLFLEETVVQNMVRSQQQSILAPLPSLSCGAILRRITGMVTPNIWWKREGNTFFL